MKIHNPVLAVIATSLIAAGCSNSSVATRGAGAEASFGYTGQTAPQFWECLKSDYEACGNGRAQSPINIVTENVVVDGNLPQVQADYHKVDAVLINNGHTLEVEYHKGSKVTFGTEEYELLQFHFHELSEHRMDGEPADMEAHLVHRNADGNLLVIAVLINVGAENPFFAKFWNQFPSKVSQIHTQVAIDAADLLPADLSYYTYQGSLTTPPCSEIVTWVVLKMPIEMSRAQFDFFTLIIGNDARPVQALNGRVIRSPN